MLRTSLDVVLRVRDQAEQRARAEVGAAARPVNTANARLQEAAAQARRGAPQHAGSCDAWLVAVSDHADLAARAEVTSAEQALDDACRSEQAAREVHVGARTAQRVIARVIDAKREARAREDVRREQAGLDELAVLRA